METGNLLKRVLFAEGRIIGTEGSVYFISGNMDELFNAGTAGTFHHVLCAKGVGGQKGCGIVDGPVDVRFCCKVDHCINFIVV
ncbi:hypothetical protein ADUPG1_002769, partial [Aduncisulcus paluster]